MEDVVGISLASGAVRKRHFTKWKWPSSLGDSGSECVAGWVGIEFGLGTDISQAESEVCISGLVLVLFCVFFFFLLASGRFNKQVECDVIQHLSQC